MYYKILDIGTTQTRELITYISTLDSLNKREMDIINKFIPDSTLDNKALYIDKSLYCYIGKEDGYYYIIISDINARSWSESSILYFDNLKDLCTFIILENVELLQIGNINLIDINRISKNKVNELISSPVRDKQYILDFLIDKRKEIGSFLLELLINSNNTSHLVGEEFVEYVFNNAKVFLNINRKNFEILVGKHLNIFLPIIDMFPHIMSSKIKDINFFLKKRLFRDDPPIKNLYEILTKCGVLDKLDSDGIVLSYLGSGTDIRFIESYKIKDNEDISKIIFSLSKSSFSNYNTDKINTDKIIERYLKNYPEFILYDEDYISEILSFKMVDLFLLLVRKNRIDLNALIRVFILFENNLYQIQAFFEICGKLNVDFSINQNYLLYRAILNKNERIIEIILNHPSIYRSPTIISDFEKCMWICNHQNVDKRYYERIFTKNIKKYGNK